MSELTSDRLGRLSNDDTAATARADDEESQMRKALGLMGEPARHRPEPERSEPVHRMTERTGSGGLHRRRFVQDGDVPVTVLRRESGHEPLAARPVSAANPPTSSRLQRAEAALAAETAARERLERQLHEAQALIRDLQTKIGHADLARVEAVDALRHEREASAQLGRDAAVWQERLNEAEERERLAEAALAPLHERLAALKDQLHQEMRLRQAAEKALQVCEVARVKTPRQALPDVEPASIVPRSNGPESIMPASIVFETPSAPVRRLSDTAAISPAIRRRRAAEPAVVEQEPVKWWLNTKGTSKRQRRPE